MVPANIFAELPTTKLPDELIETLASNKHCEIKRIVSTGQVTPEGEWYDQSRDEWVLLLQGDAKILFEDQTEVELTTGNYLYIKAHQRHRVSWTHPDKTCIWLAVYT